MECLRSTVPAKWRWLLNCDTPCELSTDQNNFRIIVPKSNEQVLTKTDNKKDIWHSYRKFGRWPHQTLHEVENCDFSFQIQRKPIWKSAYDNFSDNKYCDLHWQVLHRAHTLAPALFKRKKDNSSWVQLQLTPVQMIKMKLWTIYFLTALAFNPSLDTPNHLFPLF